MLKLPPSILESAGAISFLRSGAHAKRSQAVDTTPQVAKLRAASGTRDFFNPAVRFQNVESQPELSSGLFSPEKRDFGVVLPQVHVRHFDQGRGWIRDFVGRTVGMRTALHVLTTSVGLIVATHLSAMRRNEA